MNNVSGEDEAQPSREDEGHIKDNSQSVLFENTPDPIVKVEYDGGDPVIRKTNSAFERVFGFDSDDVVGRTAKEVLVPDERLEEHISIKERVLHDEPVEANVRRKTSIGLRNFKLRAIPFDLEDASKGAYVWYTDITERKKYEERLKFLNRSSRKLMDADSQGEIMELVLDVMEGSLNQSLAGLWSYDGEKDVLKPAVLSRTVKKAVPDREELEIEKQTAEMEAFRKGQHSYIEDYQEIESPALSDILECSLCVPVDEKRMMVIGVDEPDKIDSSTKDLVLILARHAEAAFRKNRREKELSRRSKAMEASFDGIALLNEDGEYMYVNPAHADIYGYEEPEDMIGKSWKELYQNEIAEELENKVLSDGKSRSWRGELVGKKADGTTFPQELTLSKFEDGGLICIVRDITDLKKKEEELQQQNMRLKKFGSLVSHDLKNPLNIAKGYTDLARETGDQEKLEKVDQALERMESIIKDLVLITRRESELRDEEDELEDIFIRAFQFASDNSASYSIEGDLGFRIKGIAITSIFENLISNSIEHNDELVNIRVGPLENGFYYEDDGQGIDEDKRDQIFEHGYTTSSEGRGIGLSTVERLSELNGWSIEVTESEEGGARFEIYFDEE